MIRRPPADRSGAPPRGELLATRCRHVRDHGHGGDHRGPRRCPRRGLRGAALRGCAGRRRTTSPLRTRGGDDIPYGQDPPRTVPARAAVGGSRGLRASRRALRSGPPSDHAAEARGDPLMTAEAGSGTGDVVVPDALPVLPLRDAVVLPLTTVPLVVGQPRSVRLVDDVMRGNRLVALVAQHELKAEASTLEDLYRIGTVGMIHQLMRAPDGSVRLVVQGLERIRLLDLVGTEPYLVARVEVSREQTVVGTEIEALRLAVVDVFRRLVGASPELPDEFVAAAESIGDPLRMVYFVATVVPLDLTVRQALLELDPASAKLRRLVDILQKELAVREL